MNKSTVPKKQLIDAMSADAFFEGATTLGELIEKTKRALKELKELNEQFGPETEVRQEKDSSGNINLEFHTEKWLS